MYYLQNIVRGDPLLEITLGANGNQVTFAKWGHLSGLAAEAAKAR